MDDKEPHGKARGGVARAKSLTAEQRKAISRKGAIARWTGPLKRATHGSPDHPLKIGDIELQCYVLDDESRVLSQRGVQGGMGMSMSGGSKSGEQRLAVFFDSLAAKGIDVKDLPARIRNPIRFMLPGGGTAYGYEATILADICDAVLAARKVSGGLQKQQEHIADRCEILVRGFARVGIIALVDEATGYQKDRARDALARILEAFVAKELQPWVKTFPGDYYQELFRLRGLPYRVESVKRPQYFGCLTNDIVYKRIAPGVLDELRRVTEKNDSGRPRHRYFQHLTANVGCPKLREHLGAVVATMQLSNDYKDFMGKLDKIRPKFAEVGETLPLPLTYEQEHDDGRGL